MNADRCPACGKFVLYLMGQYEKLDSYYLEPGGPRPASAGVWHTKCLRASADGPAWGAARQHNFVGVRGYQLVARAEEWSVLADPRDGERLAISDAGPLLDLPTAAQIIRRGDEAGYRKRIAMYNLQWHDERLVSEVQAALVRDGHYPLSVFIDALGLTPYLEHPEWLADARLCFDEELQEEWHPDWLCVALEHGVFLPDALIPHCAPPTTGT